jgi:hypothetical protein
VLLRRQSRSPPTDHVELIEFFLNTQADDMEVWSLLSCHAASRAHARVCVVSCVWGGTRRAPATAAGPGGTRMHARLYTSGDRSEQLGGMQLQHVLGAVVCRFHHSMPHSRLTCRPHTCGAARRRPHAHTHTHAPQFEVARCRPQLTPEFFKQLDTLVGQVRGTSEA